MLYRLILSFESVEETLVCDYSNMVLFIKKNEKKNKANKTKQNKNKEKKNMRPT